MTFLWLLTSSVTFWLLLRVFDFYVIFSLFSSWIFQFSKYFEFLKKWVNDLSADFWLFLWLFDFFYDFLTTMTFLWLLNFFCDFLTFSMTFRLFLWHFKILYVTFFSKLPLGFTHALFAYFTNSCLQRGAKIVNHRGRHYDIDFLPQRKISPRSPLSVTISLLVSSDRSSVTSMISLLLMMGTLSNHFTRISILKSRNSIKNMSTLVAPMPLIYIL